jgi:hypothetical protein
VCWSVRTIPVLLSASIESVAGDVESWTCKNGVAAPLTTTLPLANVIVISEASSATILSTSICPTFVNSARHRGSTCTERASGDKVLVDERDSTAR